MVLPPRIELGSRASEARVLSVELQERMNKLFFEDVPEPMVTILDSTGKLSDDILFLTLIVFRLMIAAFPAQATVAQLVEQGPLKPKVLGSTPSRRTNKNDSQAESFLYANRNPRRDERVIPPCGVSRVSVAG